MSLSPGTRVGGYEILSTLGTGGMGEVYRARDTRLGRDVAVKILPETWAADPDRRARFEREAKTLAALNHPHIAQIYGLESATPAAPWNALVMELVEGDDLAARIARGPLAIDDALPIAHQIAEALEAAHDQGIVHRDLKPANIKVRPDHTVKVLDFGLAKALEQGSGFRDQGPRSRDQAPAGATGAFNSPTVTSPAMTLHGMILGTAAYMSPEQARGRPLDKRTDIWSFGCVLYEMLTGRAAFEGETITDVLGAIVKSDPDWTRLPPDTPPNVATLLRRCLRKDPARRLRDIGAAIVELDADEIAQARAVPAVAVDRRPISRRKTAALIAAIIVVAAAAATVAYLARPVTEARLQKFHLAVQDDGGIIRHPVIAPDGRSVVYGGQSRLWVQSIDRWDARELPGTEAAARPFWSPDAKWIAFFRSEQLLKVPVAGGPVVRIASLPAVQAPMGANSGAWTEDGVITVSLASGPLLRVPSGGGEAKPFGRDLRDIEALPNGAIVGVIVRATAPDAIGVLRDGTVHVIHETSNVRHPTYAAPGFLLYERRAPNAGLWAAPFSLDRLALSGEPFVIGAGSELSAARDGTISFLADADVIPRELAWFSLDGRRGARLADPRDWIEGVAVSKDGRRVLASATDGIWAYDADTGARSRITNGSSDITPDWIDDDRIVFVRSDHGDDPDAVARGTGVLQAFSQPVVVMKRLTSGEERVLARHARFPRVTADGRRVVFNIQVEGDHAWEVGWIDLDRPSEIHRLPAAHRGARFPSVSPDGSLVAYVSGEAAGDEVFLTRLPSGEGKWQLSTSGGGWTLFNPRGDAVVYRALDGTMMSVPIGAGREIKIGQPQKLFDWGGTWAPFYDFAADGQRGVAAMPVGKNMRVPKLSIVQHWQLEFGGQ